MRFVKMHALGNDYVYIDAVGNAAMESHFAGAHGARLVRQLSDRHTGVGSDGVILVCRPTAGGHVRMRMFNADGSESEMCGNGVRCVAKFAHDRLGLRTEPMLVETGRGTLVIDYRTEDELLVSATVDMGEPVLDLAQVPVSAAQLAWTRGPLHGLGTPTGTWAATFVSMGNPHAVIFEDDGAAFTGERLASFELDRLGPVLEHHRAFPRRANIHLVSVRSADEADMRTWERGAGLTQACGTGACAVLVAGVLTERLAREALLHLPGGDLRIRWDALTNHVFMTGPATDVFEGEWPDY